MVAYNIQVLGANHYKPVCGERKWRDNYSKVLVIIHVNKHTIDQCKKYTGQVDVKKK